MTLKRRLKIAEERAAKAGSARRGPPTWEELFAAAHASASPEEAEEVERLAAEHDARGEAGGPPPEGERLAVDPAEDAELFALWERMLERIDPFWAAEFRRYRDLPTIRLEQLKEAWEAAGRKHSTWESDREYWQVAQAAWSRWNAVRHRGAPVISDPEETARMVAAVREEGITIDEISALVGRT